VSAAKPAEPNIVKECLQKKADALKNDAGSVIDIGTQKGWYTRNITLMSAKKYGTSLRKTESPLKESEVCVKFIVEKNGALKDLYIYKSSVLMP